MNFQEYIKHLIETDDGYREWRDKAFTNAYKLADNQAKKNIDTIFLNLTGFNFDTILKEYEKQKGK